MCGGNFMCSVSYVAALLLHVHDLKFRSDEYVPLYELSPSFYSAAAPM